MDELKAQAEEEFKRRQYPKNRLWLDGVEYMPVGDRWLDMEVGKQEAERAALLAVLDRASRVTEGREYGLYLPDKTFVAMPAGNVMVREEALNDLVIAIGRCAFIDQARALVGERSEGSE